MKPIWAGGIATYVCVVIATYTIVPPLSLWQGLLCASGFVGIPAILIAYWHWRTGCVLSGGALVVAIAATWADDDHVTTAGHWGLTALVFGVGTLFGGLFLGFALEEREREAREEENREWWRHESARRDAQIRERAREREKAKGEAKD